MFALIVRVGDFYVNAQGALAIQQAVVPDEHRHLGTVVLYSQSSPWTGLLNPAFSVQQIWLGDVTHDANFLYYYLAGLALKIARHIGLEWGASVLMLRLINVVLGVLVLFTLRRIGRQLRIDEYLVVISVLLFSLTGRFVWQAAGVSYDTLAILFFVLFVTAAISAIRYATATNVLLTMAFAMLGSVTKYVSMPFLGAGALAVLAVVIYRAIHDHHQVSVWPPAPSPAARLAMIASSLLFLSAATLFLARIGGNLLEFGDVQPLCTESYTHEQCMGYDIYARNYLTMENLKAAAAQGIFPAAVTPIDYFGYWLDMMYKSLFFYWGRTADWQPSNIVLSVGSVALAIVAAMAIAGRRTLPELPRLFVLGLAAAYSISIFFFNLKTFLKYNQGFAHQGRYFLPFLGLIFLFVATRIQSYLQSSRWWRHPVVIYPAVIASILVVAIHSPLVSFFLYARDNSWYTDFAIQHFGAYLPLKEAS
ncbi:MAG: DUF2142 domain-containing protein [Protaetiibacter sp.]